MNTVGHRLQQSQMDSHRCGILRRTRKRPQPLLPRNRRLATDVKGADSVAVVPTAGSFFKNIEPSSLAGRRQAAGWFLEQAGALGLRVGGARTFERHANIIIAEPGCTASNVEELAARMAAAVEDKFGLVLEREVKLIPGDLAEKDQ